MPKLLEIPEDQLNEALRLAAIGCKNNTIELKIGWTPGYINTRKDIKKKIEQKRAEFRAEIANTQFSMRKQPVMAIWLGKQHLDQSDKAKAKLEFKEIKIIQRK